MKKVIFSLVFLAACFTISFAQLKVENAGVGIGDDTKTPVEKLEVFGGVKLGTTANSNAGTMRWSGTDFEGFDGTAWKSFTSGGAGLWAENTGNVVIDNKVGVGLTSPEAKLHINGPIVGTSLGLKVTDSDGGGGFFAVQDATGASGAFIPTFNFSAKGGSSGFGGAFLAQAPAAMDVNKHALGATMLIVTQRETNANIQQSNLFMLRNYRTPVITVSKDGNMGIGTNVPSQKLHVNGNILANNVSVPSDRRLKKGISRFNLGLQEVLVLNPVTFQYNGKGGISDTETTHIGIIAQELQKVDKRLVNNIELQENSKEIVAAARSSSSDDLIDVNIPEVITKEYLSVNDKSITYMLINAIKEQQAMLKEQRELIEKLETKLNAIVTPLKKDTKTTSKGSN